MASEIETIMLGGLTIGETVYPSKTLNGQTYKGLIATLEGALQLKGRVGLFRRFQIRPWSFNRFGGQRAGFQFGKSISQQRSRNSLTIEREIVIVYMLEADNSGEDQIAAAELEECLDGTIWHWAGTPGCYPGVQLIGDITGGQFREQAAGTSSGDPNAWWIGIERIFTLRYDRVA